MDYRRHALLHYILSLILLSTSGLFGISVPFVRAQQNVTVDDGDLSIVYAPPGAWTRSDPSPLDVGGSHMLTQNPNGTATFNFTGVAVYFLSPKWPYLVGVAIALDGGVANYVDLVDHSSPNTGQGPETVQSEVVWSATGLEDRLHTLVVSVPQGQPYAIVDGLIFTTSNGNGPLLSSTATSPSSTTMPPASSSPADTTGSTSKPKVRAISVVFGVIFGIIALLLFALGAWRCYRNKKRPVSEAWTAADPSSAAGSRPSSMRKSIFGTRKSTQPTPFVEHPQAPSPAHGYYMEQREDGRWSNPHYGYVGSTPAPPLSASTRSSYPLSPHNETLPSVCSNLSVAGQYTTVPEPYYYPGSTVDPYSRAPNRYEPGNTLSTITEKSTPGQTGGYSTRTLPNSPDSYRTMDLGNRTPASQNQRQLSQSDHPLPPPPMDTRTPYSTIPHPFPSAPNTDVSSQDTHSTRTGYSSDSKRPFVQRKATGSS